MRQTGLEPLGRRAGNFKDFKDLFPNQLQLLLAGCILVVNFFSSRILSVDKFLRINKHEWPVGSGCFLKSPIVSPEPVKHVLRNANVDIIPVNAGYNIQKVCPFHDGIT